MGDFLCRKQGRPRRRWLGSSHLQKHYLYTLCFHFECPKFLKFHRIHRINSLGTLSLLSLLLGCVSRLYARPFDAFAMTFQVVTTFYRKSRNCFTAVADVLGLAAIVMLVFLTTCQVKSTTPQAIAVNTTTTLGNRQYQYQSLLFKPGGAGWKTHWPRFVHYSFKAIWECGAVYLPYNIATVS